ncbi:hypothetical protein AURDEDRAFT_163281 [Auricularia subglabra TFB-10046 SS5]|nr:hypothetical protein AURDEDRAFT_163281 [Auricularia subglabra TFB-10046 SS5]
MESYRIKVLAHAYDLKRLLTYSPHFKENGVLDARLTCTGINGLPPEILSHIFRLGLPNDEAADFHPHLRRTRGIISSVCRSWREVVTCDPRFWNRLLLFPHPQLPTMLTFPSNAQSFPLTIDLQMHSRLCTPESHSVQCDVRHHVCMPALLAALGSLLPRCRSLRIRGSYDDWYFLSDLFPLPSFPKTLKDLDLICWPQRVPWERPLALLSNIDSPESLHSLSIGLVNCIDPTACGFARMTNLRTLDLRGADEFAHSDLWAALAACAERLQTFRIHGWKAPTDDDSSLTLDSLTLSRKVNLVALRELELTNLTQEAAITLILLFVAPDLEALVLDRLHHPRLSYWLYDSRMLAPSTKNVTTFRLHAERTFEDCDMSALLGNFPRLECLSISFGDSASQGLRYLSSAVRGARELRELELAFWDDGTDTADREAIQMADELHEEL